MTGGLQHCWMWSIHCNIHFNLQLTDNEKLDLVEYLKSLPESEAVATNNRQGLRIIRP